MRPITIGVPVYNGGDLLDASLACLARQTFGDFEVLIFDNGSTDATPDIARRWAASDRRFRYFRHDRNIGGIANFIVALEAAESPWFLWRAADDLSDDNYVERLYALATSSPGARLVVSPVIAVDYELNRTGLAQPSADFDPSTMRGRIKTLFEYTPCWFYGLWDRQTAEREFLTIWGNFHYPFASDHLSLYGPIIDGCVRVAWDTNFISRAAPARQDRKVKQRKSFSTMYDIRRSFVSEIARKRAERNLSAWDMAQLRAIEPFYLHRILPSLLKMGRTRLRELVGLAGEPSKSWHIAKLELPEDRLPREIVIPALSGDDGETSAKV